MPRYEYKVVPAPTKGLKGKGVRGAEARFSHAVQELMNGLSGYGWEYQRAETLPSTERSGLTGSTTEWRNVLVFRRLRENDADAFAPELLPAPVAVAPVAKEAAETVDESAEKAAKTVEKEAAKPAAADTSDKTDKAETADAKSSIHTDVAWDNGVEDPDDASAMGDAAAKLAAVRKLEKDIKSGA